jgi:ABC-type sulfate transport system permease subunit
MKNRIITESKPVKYSLITISLLFVLVFLIIPLFSVFFNALEKGYSYYLSALQQEDAISAMKLSLLTVCITVPLNLVFGVSASYLIARFEFIGKSLLTTLIDIPFSVSPVISGLLFVTLFGREGIFGNLLEVNDLLSLNWLYINKKAYDKLLLWSEYSLNKHLHVIDVFNNSELDWDWKELSSNTFDL